MKYGINLLLWTDDPTGEHCFPLLEKIKETGYDGVEIPIFSNDSSSFARLGKHLDELDLERTGLTIRTDQDDPSSSNAEISRRGIDANKAAVDSCAALGATHLCGPYHSALGHFSGASPTADQLDRAIESMHEVAEHAAANNVLLVPEYLNRFELYLLNSAADMAGFVDAVNHPHCKMMYDTFHAHIEEKNITEAIRTAGHRIAHVHISENDRSTPGTGQVRWKETFEALHEVNYDEWLVVEAFGLALPKLAAATKIWRRMFSTEETLMRESLEFLKESWDGTKHNPA